MIMENLYIKKTSKKNKSLSLDMIRSIEKEVFKNE